MTTNNEGPTTPVVPEHDERVASEYVTPLDVD